MSSKIPSKGSLRSKSSSSSTPEASKEFLQIPEVIQQQFCPREEFQDFKSAVQFCHKGLSRCISYFKFCYSNWLANILNSIDKSIRINISSVKLVNLLFLQAIREFEAKSGPLKQPQSCEDDASKAQLRRRYYDAYLEELKEIRKSAKLIQDDAERYLKFLKNIYTHFLSHGPQDFNDLNSAMKANSKIITKWLEQIMAKKIIFHFKAIRDYRLHALQPTEGDNNMLLLLLDSWIRKAAEDYINSIEKVIRESHKFLDFTADALETNDIYSKSTKVDAMALTMSDFFEKIETGIVSACDSTVVSEIITEITFSELRNRLNIPSVVISLTKEENDDDSSNSETFSIIGRQFGVQKIYEANKSAIVGHDLQNLLKKTEKQLKLTLKHINRDNSRTLHNLRKVVNKTHQSLITSMAQIEKNSCQDLEANRYRAEMYISYKVDQEVKDGKPKKNIQKYVKELSARTRIHAEKIKYVSKLLIKFFDLTNQEYSLLMKESIPDFESIQTHKVNACKSILHACQCEFSYMAEIAHVQLLNQARELEMKNTLTYAIGEFVKGMKWVDHHFMKASIDSSRESLQALMKFSLTGKDFSLKVKSTDIQESIEVINLYFAGFLKSHMTPDEADDNLIERLQNISSSSNSDAKDSSDDDQDPGEGDEISKENGNQEMNKLSVTAAGNSKKMLTEDNELLNDFPTVKQSSSTPGLGYNGNSSHSPFMASVSELNPEIFLPEKI